MPLAIKSVVGNYTSGMPTHASGDLLLAFLIGSNIATPSGWTNIYGSGAPSYSWDACRAIYRIADSSSVANPYPGNYQRIYSITGSKTSDPIAGFSGSQVSSSAQTTVNTVAAVPVPGASGTSNGSAYFLNGYSGYGPPDPSLVSASSSGFTMGTGDFTIECWYNSKSFLGNDYLFDLGTNGTRVQFYGNQVYFNAGGATSAPAASGVGFTADTWYHLAMVRSGSTVTGYINGTSVASFTYSGNMTDTACKIGGYGGGGNNNFNGYISNFRIVKGTAVYTSNFTPTGPLTPISGTSLLTANSSSAATDSSSNNLTLTKSSTVLVNGNNPFSSLNDGLRFSLFTGYGAGGNPWGGNTSLSVGGPGVSMVDSTTYMAFIEGGGAGPIHNMASSANAGVSYGGGRAMVTVSINPAPTSGFFSMF